MSTVISQYRKSRYRALRPLVILSGSVPYFSLRHATSEESVAASNGFFAGCSPLAKVRGQPAQNDSAQIASFAPLRYFRLKEFDDVRESPALDVIELLRAKGADVRYHDPYVPCIHHNGFQMQGEPDLDAVLAAADCAVVTDHACHK